jgi:O-antigen/teichoic acid export membrane protein
MESSACDARPGPTEPTSLRRNFAWTFTGNALNGFSQWAVLSLIAKLGTGEMLGEYAFAVAVMLPLTMLSHLNLRAVLATDMEERHPFGDYLAVRLWATAAILVAVVVVALVLGRGYTRGACMVLVALSLSTDTISDIYYGAMQRSERMAEIAVSMIARGVLALVAFGVVLFLTRSLVPSIAMLVVARIAVFLAYDRPRGSQGQRLSRSGGRAQLEIFQTALPLGVVLMLVSYTSNVPRYVVEHYLGTRGLGVFAAMAAFLMAGSTVVSALGQSATPRLARYFSQRDTVQFRRLTLRLIALALALGVVGVAGAAVAGSFVLRVFYSAEYGAYGRVLTELMGAAALVYVAAALGFVITSARSFRAQMPVLALVVATSAVAGWLLVPVMGLSGAALAVAAGASVQIAGELLILRRALGRLERAA